MVVHNSMDLRRKPLMEVRCWWFFAFIVSLMVFLSALLFLNGEAHAKPTGGDPGGGKPKGDVSKQSGNSGGGGSNNDSHSGKGTSSGAAKAATGGNTGGDTSHNGNSSGRGISSKEAKVAFGNQSDYTLSGSQRNNPALDKANDSNIVRGDVDTSHGDFANGATGSSDDSNTTLGGVTNRAAGNAKPIGENADSLANTAGSVSKALGPALSPASGVIGPIDRPAPAAREPVVTSATMPSGPALEPVAQVRNPLPAEDVFSLNNQPSSWSLHEQSLLSQPVLLAGPIPREEASSIPVASALVAVNAAADEDLRAGLGPITVGNAEYAPLDDNLAFLNLFAEVEAALTQMLQSSPAKVRSMNTGSSGGSSSSPASGLLALGGLSGGSSNSSSSTGFELLGAIALLSILLAGGKHVWETRETLKPSSVVLPALERPG